MIKCNDITEATTRALQIDFDRESKGILVSPKRSMQSIKRMLKSYGNVRSNY